MAVEKLIIPDFGDVQEIAVVEIFVAVGDTVEVEDSLIALESEKAVMDIPSALAGVIKEILVKEDDVVSSGDVIALIETTGAAAVSEEDAKDTDAAPAQEKSANKRDSTGGAEVSEEDVKSTEADPKQEKSAQKRAR